MLLGVDVNGINNHLYFSRDHGRRCIDCQASAIKSASLVSFVGLRFLREIVEDQFSDQSFIPTAVRNEVKVKYHYGSTRTIPNAPSLGMYPEHCDHLAVRYGPDDDVLAAKRANRIEFQRRTGLIVNPDAILLYWPSRLDPSQKGIELLEEIAQSFVTEHPDVQIAIVGDGVGSDRTHEDICGRIAWTSGGKITYQHFSESLSMLGFGAASDVFGVSLYEPCGQIDQVGNLFGATSTNRDTGGYHDKILELRLAGEGVSEDEGNGFLFLNYDTGGLWYGLHKSVEFHRRPAEVRDRQVRRIMRETRQHYDVGKMIDAYIDAYETINGGRPLV
jgi:glycogen synthase